MSGATTFDTIATGITSAIGIAKAIISADRAFDKAELKLKLSDLMVQLAETRTDLAQVQAQTIELWEELELTKKKLVFAGTMEFEAPYYWNIAGGRRDGPYCATCWDGREHLAIRLYEAQRGYWQCHTCKNTVEDDSYSDPDPASLEP